MDNLLTNRLPTRYDPAHGAHRATAATPAVLGRSTPENLGGQHLSRFSNPAGAGMFLHYRNGLKRRTPRQFAVAPLWKSMWKNYRRIVETAREPCATIKIALQMNRASRANPPSRATRKGSASIQVDSIFQRIAPPDAVTTHQRPRRVKRQVAIP